MATSRDSSVIKVIKKGWLGKRHVQAADIAKRSLFVRRRFFLLLSNLELRYFETDDTLSWKGIIDLTNCIDLRRPTPRSLRLYLPGGLVIELSAVSTGSGKDIDEWYTVLKNLLAMDSPRKTSDTLKRAADLDSLPCYPPEELPPQCIRVMQRMRAHRELTAAWQTLVAPAWRRTWMVLLCSVLALFLWPLRVLLLDAAHELLLSIYHACRAMWLLVSVGLWMFVGVLACATGSLGVLSVFFSDIFREVMTDALDLGRKVWDQLPVLRRGLIFMQRHPAVFRLLLRRSSH